MGPVRALLLLAALVLAPAAAETECTATTDYLDISSLNCETCAGTNADGTPDHKVVDSSDLDDAGNVLSCTCDAGYYKLAATCDSYGSAVECAAFSCAACAEAAASDRSVCMPCDGVTATYDSTTAECVCATDGYVLTEFDSAGTRLAEKMCVACPTDSYAFTADTGGFEADAYTCQSCSDENMALDTTTGLCTCNDGYTETGIAAFGGVVCLLTAEATPITSQYMASATEVVFRDVERQVDGALSEETVDSKWFSHLYLQSAVNCWQYGGPTDLPACQALGNLCALQMFNPDSTACVLFEAIRLQRPAISNDQAGWSETLPWLEYQDDGAQVVLNRDIEMEVSFNNDTIPNTYDELRFVLAEYDVYGNWVGTEILGTQFFYCDTSSTTESGPSMVTHWLQFGVGYTQGFYCDLDGMLSGDLPSFYDLYLVDEATGDLFPVPVRVKNYREGDNSLAYEANRNEKPEEETDDVFTRRFFLWDSYSGVEEADASADPTILRYARNIKLQLTVQADDTQKMFPPVLTIEYVERPTASFGSDGMGRDSIVFSVEYTMDTSNFWDWSTAIFILTCVGAVGFSILRFYNYQKRHARGTPVFNCSATTAFAICAMCGCFAKCLFAYLFMICSYWYIFFKMEDAVAALLPPQRNEYGTSDDYYNYEVLLHLCFFCQCVRVGEIIFRQTRCDVFFMDWEKKRGPNIPVSWWRTLFVANEWSERQAQRRTDIVFTLVFVALVLVACDGQYWATPQPNADDLSEGPLNPVLRLALIVFWFYLFAIIQLLWKWGIQDRWFTEPMTTQFLDLSTVAKISVMLLDEPYHGYYLHCCSPYGYADGSMLDMAEQLDQESKALTTDRGLDDSPLPNAQVFEIHVADRFRRRYDDVYKSLVQQVTQQHAHETSRFASQQARRGGRAPPSRLVKATRQLNRFLQDFVSNDHAEFKRIFRMLPYWPRAFGIPPDMPTNTRQSVFVPDETSEKYAALVFYGVEGDLLLFDVLTLLIFTEWTDDLMLGVIFTYLMTHALMGLRSYLGTINLVNKTLVDDRFLI